MAYQADCGDLIIDAVLTDIGRKKLIRGDLQIVSFGLGDDEIDYSLKAATSCTDLTEDFTNISDSLTFEALGKHNVNIQYGLVSIPRDDVLYVPKLHLNELVENTAKKFRGIYYLAVNEETVDKIKADVGIEYVLQQDQVIYNQVLIESGINFPSTEVVPKDYRSKKSYILDYELYDKYFYVHCDRRFIDKILVSDPNGKFANTKSNRLTNTLQPLMSTKQINIESYVDNFSVFKATATDNEIYKLDTGMNEMIHTVVDGPRASVLGLNFVCDPKMLNKASASPDDRYTRFGVINVSPFSTNTKYDYVDTVVLVEGTVTKSQIKIPIRIIRYRSG